MNIGKWNVSSPSNVSSKLVQLQMWQMGSGESTSASFIRHALGKYTSEKDELMFSFSKEFLTSTSNSLNEHLRGWTVLKVGRPRSISRSGARKGKKCLDKWFTNQFLDIPSCRFSFLQFGTPDYIDQQHRSSARCLRTGLGNTGFKFYTVKLFPSGF